MRESSVALNDKLPTNSSFLSSSPPFSSSSSSDSSFFPFLAAPLAETLDYFLERGFLTSSEESSSSSEESFLAAAFFWAAALATGFFFLSSSEESSSEESYFFYYLEGGTIPLPFTIKSTSDSDDISSSSLESFCFFAFPLVAAATFLPTFFFGASSSDSSESSEDTGTTCFCFSLFLACF